MRKLILSFCFLMAVLLVQAAPLTGIRIESTMGPIIVFIDGAQVCTPTTSCFVANLRGGRYRIEVYAASHSERRDGGRTGERLFDESYYYRGRDIEDIRIDNDRGNNHPNTHFHKEMIMDDDTFGKFLAQVRKTPFNSDRTKLIETSLITTDFTSEQCLSLMKSYKPFCEVEIMQKMYPRIVDKQNFFTVIDCLTFESEKNRMNNFVRDYHSQQR